MNSVDPVVARLVKKVEILRSENARDIERAATTVHYIEGGRRLVRQVGAGRAVHFERIETSRVRDTVPGTMNARRFDLSPRGIARRLYHGAGTAWSALRPPLRLDAPVFDARVLEPNNMAHLLLDLIPCCLYARRVAGAEVRFLFRTMQPPFRALLDVFDIRPFMTRRHIEADFIRICGTRGLAVHDVLGTFDCASITSLPDVYRDFDFSSSVGFERVFLARRGARALVNHADVQSLVTRYGYETVFMEDYPIRDQLGIGARAQHVVGIHGAAMAFLAMSRHVDSVVELMPQHVYHEMFALCLYPRARRYHLIISEFDRAVAHSGWPAIGYYKGQPFAVDLELLEQSLADVHRAVASPVLP